MCYGWFLRLVLTVHPFRLIYLLCFPSTLQLPGAIGTIHLVLLILSSIGESSGISKNQQESEGTVLMPVKYMLKPQSTADSVMKIHIKIKCLFPYLNFIMKCN